jgi:hypothetical protein
MKSTKQLRTYASGDGSLSFCWFNTQTNNATGTTVMKSHITCYMKTKEGKRLAANDWTPMLINWQWRLVKPCKLVSMGVLKLDKTLFYFSIKGKDVNSFEKIMDSDMDIAFKPKGMPAGTRHNLLNQSTRAVIRFYLNHIEAIEAVLHAR